MPQALSSTPEASVEGLLEQSIAKGCRVIRFPFVVSLIVVKFELCSKPYLLRPGEGSKRAACGYALISLLLGWWSIPWGPMLTIKAVWVTMRGGEDITYEFGTPVEHRWWPACPNCGTKYGVEQNGGECTKCGSWLPEE